MIIDSLLSASFLASFCLLLFPFFACALFLLSLLSPSYSPVGLGGFSFRAVAPSLNSCRRRQRWPSVTWGSSPPRSSLSSKQTPSRCCASCFSGVFFNPCCFSEGKSGDDLPPFALRVRAGRLNCLAKAKPVLSLAIHLRFLRSLALLSRLGPYLFDPQYPRASSGAAVGRKIDRAAKMGIKEKRAAAAAAARH